MNDIVVCAPSVPAALKALDLMRVELTSAGTYTEIKKIEAQAQVILKALGSQVEQVRGEAQITIACCQARIGEELAKIPKARGGGQVPKSERKNGNLTDEKSISEKEATGIDKSARSRAGRLAKLGMSKVEEIGRELIAEGKDATVKAILSVAREGEIKQQRTAFEARRDRGARVEDLVAMAERGERFPVIYADPPWEFKVYSGKGKQRSAERYYDTESLEGIKALPIEALAAKDCTLFVWGVWPELPGALEVIRAWGFEYKTVAFVWVKQNSSGDGLHTGMGYHTRANTEFCLLATRGSPPRDDKGVHQVILSPVGAHSEKPEEARARIERLRIGPYLELFGRRPVSGWTTWGNELAAELAAGAAAG
jgi:N6-adenosine-specific RNA methylase IME4